MQPKGECPVCGFQGRFDAGGVLIPRMNAICPQCKSWERNRLLKLAIDRGEVSFEGMRVLHFAPEVAVRRFVDRKRVVSGKCVAVGVDVVGGRIIQQKSKSLYIL